MGKHLFETTLLKCHLNSSEEFDIFVLLFYLFPVNPGQVIHKQVVWSSSLKKEGEVFIL